MSDTVVIDARWCLVASRDRVVPENDPEARFLHWLPGDVVSREEAERLGAVKAPRRKPGRPPAAKVKQPTENKVVAAAPATGSGLVYGKAGRSKE